jgi:membrane-associated phospholipid phosphatase
MPVQAGQPQPRSVNRRLLIAFVSGILLFALDATAVQSHAVDLADLHLHQAIVGALGHDTASRLSSITMARHSRVNRAVVLPLLVAGLGIFGWLAARGRVWDVAAVVVAVPGALVLEMLLKSLITRPGPMLSASNAGLRTFPSGHAAVGITICLMGGQILASNVALRWRPAVWGLAGVGAMAVIASTLMFHFPSEVLAGVIVGILWTSTVVWAMAPLRARVRARSASAEGGGAQAG